MTIAKVLIKTSMLTDLSIIKWELLQGKGMKVVLEAFSKFRQVNLVKFGELVASQGLDNKEELGHSYIN